MAGTVGFPALDVLEAHLKIQVAPLHTLTLILLPWFVSPADAFCPVTGRIANPKSVESSRRIS